MNKPPYKKMSIAAALTVGGVFVISLIVLVSSKLPILSFDSYGQLAKIMAVEIGLLKKWQQVGSLKNSLAYDSEGGEVALLQRMLSQDSEAYPEKKITGYYGDLTVQAVRNFQREYDLSQTGIVDLATRKKLNDIFLSFLCPEPITIYPDFLMRKIKQDSPLSLDYVPPLLKDVSNRVRTAGITCLRSDVAVNVEQMFADAKQDGIELMITSGYRKPEIQKYLYDYWIQSEGERAVYGIAKPGLSEHQLGTAIDLTDSSINFEGVDRRFANSRGGQWLQANAYKYGFIMSFPEGKQSVTGFIFEPWHWRYVGASAATALRDRGITYNESSFSLDDVSALKKDL